jgi:hypothetical protein
MAEAREMAWESGLIPIQRLIADDLSSQLLPEFDDDKLAEVFFDYSEVRVLQADATDLARRWRELVHGSIAKRSEARAALGLSVDDADDVYLQPMNLLEVGPGASESIEPDNPKYDRRNGTAEQLEYDADIEHAIHDIN